MFESRWQAFASSIFSKMSLMANAHQAVNLAQGFPDFDGPDEIKEAAIAAIRGSFNQYAPSIGLAELRRQLAKRQEAQYGLSYDFAEEVTVFSGATEAIFCCILGLCRPGDEVITFEPFFDCYPAATSMAGAQLKTAALKAPNWTIDWAALESQISPKTKLLMFNSPHNPSGKVFRQDELERLAALAEKHNLIVVTDEVYEELIFSPAKHIPMASIKGMRDRTITISSTAKTFSLTGWKVGFTFAEKSLSALIRIPHQYTVFCSATPLQAGMVEAFRLSPEYFANFRQLYTERRDCLLAILRDYDFECDAPEGTYFITADYRRLRDIPDFAFAEWLTKEVGVACLPISSFYLDSASAAQRNRRVRFAFCKEVSTLQAARQKFAENLTKALQRVGYPV